MFQRLWHVSVLVGFIECSPFFDADSSLVKPRFERNKVNKGVWLRNNKQDPFVKSSLGSFIFRANSLDVESQVQNAFDPFSSKQDGMTSGFMGRYKREPHSTTNRRHRKSLNNKNKQKTTTSSFLNDYAYEVAALRDSPNNKNIDYNVYTKSVPKLPVKQQNETKEATTESEITVRKEKTKQKDNEKVITFEYLRDTTNSTEGNVSIPKRSMNYIPDIKRINLLEFANTHFNTNLNNITNTNTNMIPNNNENDEKSWQIAPVTDVIYEIVPKEPKYDVKQLKPVSERGLIKVLSMLTKTFKKIMKQHNDIKTIHGQISNMNEECKINIEKHSKKLEDFDAKYTFFLKIIEKLRVLQDKLKTKEEDYKKREEEMSRYLLKLESQQKTFLLQQQQFFNIQKLMLAQNEKINQKQNAIAKNQNDIALRQNNFARVLEKAKKMYIESKQPKLITTIANRKNYFNNVTEEKKVNKILSTTTESIKINLFSIPALNPIQNQDQLILRDIDEKPVDDLIYKYYFNNTFIDTIIKNKILPGFFIADKTAIARNAKQKRNKHKVSIIDNTRSSMTRNGTKLDTTILLPVYNETKNSSTLHRERRWINHHSKKRHRRKHHGKGNSIPIRSAPLLDLNEGNNTKNEVKTTVKPVAVKPNSIANDPFLIMATHFCNEIGQNSTKQILNWCIEKALRRLKGLDAKLVPPELANKVQETLQASAKASLYLPIHTRATNSFKLIVTEAPTVSTTVTPSSTTDSMRDMPRTATLSEFNAFFPDNDELETNLKQFDLTRDTVGNYYYDGSLHESDLVGDKSDGLSDFMPGFDSNSRVDLDTRMMELQSIRQFHSQRVKNNMRAQRKKH